VFINQTVFYRQVIFCYSASWGHLTLKAGLQVKNRPALEGVFFSYWSSVFSNTDAKAIRCLKNKFHNPFKMEF
jgi:hypothetical protein